MTFTEVESIILIMGFSPSVYISKEVKQILNFLKQVVDDGCAKAAISSDSLKIGGMSSKTQNEIFEWLEELGFIKYESDSAWIERGDKKYLGRTYKIQIMTGAFSQTYKTLTSLAYSAEDNGPDIVANEKPKEYHRIKNKSYTVNDTDVLFQIAHSVDKNGLSIYVNSVRIRFLRYGSDLHTIMESAFKGGDDGVTNIDDLSVDTVKTVSEILYEVVKPRELRNMIFTVIPKNKSDGDRKFILHTRVTRGMVVNSRIDTELIQHQINRLEK